MILNIIIIPHKHLRQAATPLTATEIQEPKTQAFLEDLVETMIAKDGLGLASPQIDKPWRVFCVATQDGPVVFINPEILSTSWRKETQEEGCLSVPNVYGLVKRSKKLTIKALNTKGEEFTLTAKGLFARVIQHENDHLNGVIFIDKATITKGQKELQQMIQS